MRATLAGERALNRTDAERHEGAPVGLWLGFLTLAFWPRVLMLGFWLFATHLLTDAYGHWIVPAIGFVIAPSTTLAYAMMWSIDDRVHGAEWLAVGFGVLLDIGMWGLLDHIRRYGGRR